ncbi:MAG: DNA repair protein RadA [Alphaproteobacteria bacterium]|nr:MAG: DNA repair protein RadA [Alphaproteobacteria bacterium]
MSKYTCNACGVITSKWSGRCESCKEWNCVVEDLQQRSRNHKVNKDIFSTLDNVEEIDMQRLKTGIDEFDRVCGSGIVKGSVILIGGTPGIGKSTLMLQVASQVANNAICAYATGEEGLSQVKIRAKRLDTKEENFFMTTSTNVIELVHAFENLPNLGVAIIDSVQTMMHPDIDSPTGSISQIRAVTQTLIDSAKQHNYAVLLIGHVTKDGSLAGPRVLEHMVDAVLYFDGDTQYDYRILRTSKNRFGPTNEIGIFKMTQQGLKEVKNPSSLFLNEDSDVSGTAIAAGIEGTRVLLCEIQALVTSSFLPSPRRVNVGWDHNKLSTLVAVIQSRCKIPLSDKDIYLNLAGGLTFKEPALDLAVIAALMSAIYDKPITNKSVFIGEVSLSGSIRPVLKLDERIKEAKKLGFETIYCNVSGEKTPEGVTKVTHIRDIKALF